jgi:hypothetical protein
MRSRSNKVWKSAVACASLLGSLSVAKAASADVCVEVDAQRDNLSESDRSATRTMLEQALINNGQRVVPPGAGCSATWKVYHLKLGQSVTVTMSSPTDNRTMKVRSVEDVPDAYSQMVKSLITGQPLGAEGGTIDRTNVTATQMSNNRVAADSLFYMRLGYGGVVGSGFTAGPAFGLGWRKELDRIAIDISTLNFVLTKKDDSYKDVSGSFIKLGVLYYFDPFANNSLYAGGGLGYGVSAVTKDDSTSFHTYTGSGMHGELSAGYEMLRASNIRLLIQLDATLPFYSTTSTFYLGTATGETKDSLYTPSFSLSLGLGFGKSNTITVRNIN